MKCSKIQNRILDLLPLSLEESLPVDILEHISTCSECRTFYQEHQEALKTIKLTNTVPFPSKFNEELMQRIRFQESINSRKTVAPSCKTVAPSCKTAAPSCKRFLWKPVYVSVMAIFILFLFVFSNPNEWLQYLWKNDGAFPADIRLFNAFANEFSYSKQTGLLYQSNEVIFHPLKEFFGEEEQWYPITVINKSGRIEIVEISFNKNHRTKRIIKDKSWYDLDSGRFVRMLSIDQKVFFLNAFDGKQLFTMQKNINKKGLSIKRDTPIDFTRPQPEEFFGFMASLPAFFAESDEVKIVNSISNKKIAGEPIQQIKTTIKKNGEYAYRYYFNITPSNNEIAEIHSFLYRNQLLTISPNTIVTIDKSNFPSGLSEIRFDNDAAQDINIEYSDIAPFSNRISLAEMREYVWKDFLYLEPDSVNQQLIEYSDMFDFSYPSKRAYLTTCWAPDGNPVIIMQSYSLNKWYGDKLKRVCKLLHSTKHGLKIWESTITHRTARQVSLFALSIAGKPLDDTVAGYLLEHPNGAFAYVVSDKPIDDKILWLLDKLAPCNNDG